MSLGGIEALPVDLAIEDILVRARLKIKKKWPFIMSTVYGLVPVPTDMIETSFVTPGLVMGYNPQFIKNLPHEDMACFVILHEAFHPRLGFFERVALLGEDYLDVANVAHDLVINVMLRDAGWMVTPGALLPATYGLPEGLTMEEYIDLLLRKAPKPKPNAGAGAEGSGGSGKSKPSGVCAGKCGNAKDPAQAKFDEKFGRSKSNVKAIERKTSADVAEAMKGSGRGTVPGFMQEWAKTTQEQSLIMWQQVLSHIVRDATGRIMSGGDDFSMLRPAKRSHLRKILRPGLVDHQVVPFFVLDTSGSMDLVQLLAAVRETCAILRELGIDEAYWCEVDSDVALEPVLVNLNFFMQDKFEFHGRGGTDFRPAFTALDRLPVRPDIMFYWTDADGQAPDEPPFDVEVVWGVIPGRYGGNRKPASWGHLVVISNDPKVRRSIEAQGEDDE